MKAAMLPLDEVGSINGVNVVVTPINATDVPLAANDYGWPRHKCLLVCTYNATRAIDRKRSRYSVVLLECLSVLEGCYLPKRLFLLSLRHAVGDLDVFMAREAEVDKPFFVEQPRRLLQKLNPPPVVFDQVVVGGED